MFSKTSLPESYYSRPSQRVAYITVGGPIILDRVAIMCLVNFDFSTSSLPVTLSFVFRIC